MEKARSVADTHILVATCPHASITSIKLPLGSAWYRYSPSRRQCPHGPGIFIRLLKMEIKYWGFALPRKEGEKENWSFLEKEIVYAKYMCLEGC